MAVPVPTTHPDLPAEFVLTPAARHMSHSSGIDATVLFPGSGLKGRVTKSDILVALKEGRTLPPLQKAAASPPRSATAPAPAAAAAPPAAPAAPAAAEAAPVCHSASAYTDTPASGMRKVIASRLAESKSTVPHMYAAHAVDVSELAGFRKRMRDLGVKVSKRRGRRARAQGEGDARGREEWGLGPS
jgi:pyruvate/2-oxoglutarate dehydrogenase complex dihydrolipoamide acyltransferase (E2) component